MDTREFYKGQIVEDDDHLNEILKPGGLVETGVDNLQVDYAVDGVISGLVVSQHAGTPDMTVDVSTGVAYDGEGKRAKVSSGQNVDLSGVTLPGGGNEKWVSVFIENLVSTAEAWVDDDGVGGYWEHNDSFLLSIVEGAEAAPPAARAAIGLAKKRLLADVKLVNGQTQILNADIDTSRRETSTWPGDRLTIDASGWSKLDTASVTAQDALDDIDSKILDPAAIAVDLIPDAGTEDLGSATHRWAQAHVNTVHIYTKIEAEAAAAEDIGDGAKPFKDFYIEDIVLYTGGTPDGEMRYDAAVAVSRYVNLAAGRPFDTDAWIYTIDTLQVWETNTASQYLAIPVNLPHGAVITDYDVQWKQATTQTTEMSIHLIEISVAGVRNDAGTIDIGGFGGWQIENADISDHTVDNNNTHLFFEIRSSSGAIEHQVRNIKVNFTLTKLTNNYGW